MGNDRALNMIMLGAVTATVGIVSEKALAQAIETVLEGKKKSLVEVNQQALVKGSQYISSSR